MAPPREDAAVNDSAEVERLGPASLAIVGVNHRTTPLDVRELLMLADAEHDTLLAGLRADGLSEAALLMTCDRIELIGLEAVPGAAVVGFARLERAAGLTPGV